jgi:hypothetical protein
MLDVRSYREADSDADNHLVVAKLGKVWQYVNKQHRSFKGKDLTSGSQMS